MTRLLGIDLGTTSFKAVVYDVHGAVLASSQTAPPDEQVTVNGFRVTVWRPEKLWEAICVLIQEAVRQLPDARLDGLAIAELGLVGYPLDTSGSPLYAGVTWIEPSAPPSSAFRDCGLEDAALFGITGNHLSPIYPPAWITWMREFEPSYAREMSRWLNVGDYVAYRLCGEMALDFSIASQTTVLDQRNLRYRPDLLRAFGLPDNIFPSPRPSGSLLGRVLPEASSVSGLPVDLPVILGGADFITGAYAAGFLDSGDAAILTGTWENVIVCSDQPELGAALFGCGAICDAHVAPNRWSIRIENLSGEVTEWYRTKIRSLGHWQLEDPERSWSRLIEEAETAPPGSAGIVFIPHVFGSYGPRHDQLARGAFIGLSGDCTYRELTRALFEGLSFQTRHALEALTTGIGRAPRRVVAMGGGTKNRFWVQNKADILGSPLEVVTTPDVTPRGAAMIAGVGVGVFSDFRDALRQFGGTATLISPSDRLTEFYQRLYTETYLPLCDELAPFNARLATLRAPLAETTSPKSAFSSPGVGT
jgi:xylulokinase